jgi:hypothetical protein
VLLAAGAEMAIVPAQRGRPEVVTGLNCRRQTFGRVLRAAAVALT